MPTRTGSGARSRGDSLDLAHNGRMSRFKDLVKKFHDLPVPQNRIGGDGRVSAVLMALTDEDATRIVLTRRSQSLRFHPGQISFPGGSLDHGETAVEAALREAHEEVGLNPMNVAVLGELPDLSLAASTNSVTPILGVIAPHEEPRAIDEREVESVLFPALTDLAEPEIRCVATIPGHTYRGPAFALDEAFVWGFTAHLLDVLLAVGGWERSWDTTRTVDVPCEYRRDRADLYRDH